MRSSHRARFLIPALASAAVLLSGCGDSDGGASGSEDSGADLSAERVAYLTLMGEDTLAVEWIEFGEGYVQAESLVRGSTTTWGTYLLDTGPGGEVTGYEARTWAGGAERGDLMRHEYLATTDSGLMMVTVQNGSSLRARPFEGGAGAVPFVDMIHWPFEAAFRRQAASGVLGDPIETFNGMTFEVERNEDGSWALIHPSLGPSTVVIGQHGEINDLDGTGSTRAYQLERVDYDTLDKDSMWAAFGSRPLGELSGRGEVATLRRDRTAYVVP